MKNKIKKSIIAAIAVLCIIALATGGYFLTLSQIEKHRYDSLVFEKIQTLGKDAIYFLNTGSSDAIILQSGNHFAMIDSGEDTDNPRGFEELNLDGYEQRVLSFLKQTAGINGSVHLDFVLGTHAHSDHIGGFDTIISDPDVSIDKAYLKEYRSEYINQGEIDEWDNQEVYDQMVNALNEKSIPIISDISSEPFSFGNFTLTILNTEYEDGSRKVGENDNSLVVLAEINGIKTLLTGDLDSYTGDEQKIGRITGRVDILKVGHHSYSHSTEDEFLSLVQPSLAVVTNSHEKADKRTIRRIMQKTAAPVIYSDDEKGIAVVFEENTYHLTNNICPIE